jgi:hypothetical protein
MQINETEYSEEYLKRLSEIGIDANKAGLMLNHFVLFCEKSEITIEEAVESIQSINPDNISKNLDANRISDIFSK